MGEPRENFAVGVNLELLERFSKKNLMLKVSKNIHLFIPFIQKQPIKNVYHEWGINWRWVDWWRVNFKYVICTIILQIVQRK